MQTLRAKELSVDIGQVDDVYVNGVYVGKLVNASASQFKEQGIRYIFQLIPRVKTEAMIRVPIKEKTEVLHFLKDTIQVTGNGSIQLGLQFN